MDASGTLSQDEAIFLQVVGKLTGNDPKSLFKNVGLMGAEALFIKICADAKDPVNSGSIRQAISDAANEYASFKAAPYLEEKASFQEKINLLEAKVRQLEREVTYSPPPKYQETILNFALGAAIGAIFTWAYFQS